MRLVIHGFLNRRKTDRTAFYTKLKLEATASSCWLIGYCISLVAMFLSVYVLFTHVEVNFWVASALNVIFLLYVPYRVGMVLYNKVMELESEFFFLRRETN
jgi:hypothetical protein